MHSLGKDRNAEMMMTTIQRMLEPRNYAFDKDKLKVPSPVRSFVPTDIRETLLVARDAAEVAFHGLKRLDEHFKQCFYRLCPMDDIDRFEDHCYSIQRLFSWRVDYSSAKTLAPTPRFPAPMFRFHVDEAAYSAYIEEHEKLRLQYLNGPYLDWRMKGRDIDDLMRSSGVTEVDKRYCHKWWTEFTGEMKPWETRFDELVLPSWTEMVDILAAVIELAVDLDNEWELVY